MQGDERSERRPSHLAADSEAAKTSPRSPSPEDLVPLWKLNAAPKARWIWLDIGRNFWIMVPQFGNIKGKAVPVDINFNIRRKSLVIVTLSIHYLMSRRLCWHQSWSGCDGKKGNHYSCQEVNIGHPAHSQSLYWLSYPGSPVYKDPNNHKTKYYGIHRSVTLSPAATVARLQLHDFMPWCYVCDLSIGHFRIASKTSC